MKSILQNNVFVEVLDTARATGVSVGAFNFFDYWSASAVIGAAQSYGTNVILQVSTPTVKHYGAETIADYVLPLKRKAAIKVALHLDHCREEVIAKQCVECGWDAIMMDYSALPMEQNIEKTAEMVAFANAQGVAVEGEVGRIQGVEEDIVSDAESLAGYDETIRFIEESGVDAIAPAIGTAHGVYKGKPNLNYALIEKLGRERCPLVIHGGTGLEEDVFHKLTCLGAAKINISTALKQSYRGAIARIAGMDSFNPIQANDIIYGSIHETVYTHIRIFSGGR